MAFDLVGDLRKEQQRLEKNKAGGAGGDYLKNFIKMPDGVGWVDVFIIPPDKSLQPLRGGLVTCTRTHKLGQNGVNPRNYHCRRELVGDRWLGNPKDDCPVCLHYTHLWQSSEASDLKDAERKRIQDCARELRPVERYYFNVIEVGRSDGTPDREEPKILSVGKTLYEKIIVAIAGSEDQNLDPLGNITDWSGGDGRILKIVKTMKGSPGQKQWANYDGSRFLDPASFGTSEERKNWKANRHDLVALRRVLSFEELKEKLQIHLGVKEATDNTAYNPQDFVKSDGESCFQQEVSVTKTMDEPKIVVADPPFDVGKSDVPPKSKESTPTKSDDFLVDDDFFQDLNGIED